VSIGDERLAAATALRRPEVSLDGLTKIGLKGLDIREPLDASTIEVDLKYEGYLKRQRAEIERSRKYERRGIPDDFCYEGLPGLSQEVVQRLGEVRPTTLGQAQRVPGVTAAAIAILAKHLERRPSEVA
jgi:tRNA uridine 5-carboxymethylaminomethyl modification enzyme